METTIKAERLSHTFTEKKVLDEVNFEVAKGSIFGLLGPSGAGKTTLIRILTGQMKQTSGKAYISGRDTLSLTPGDCKNFGIMADDIGLYERLSCYDNLMVFARIYGLDKGCAADILEKVGLTNAKNTAAAKLSKGMRGRLRLARALMTKPEILFLDEPASGLDPATADSIHRLLLAEKDKGTTIFLTTHDMCEAHKLCDEIALLHEGRIVEHGSPDDICRRYYSEKKFSIHLTDGRDITLPCDETSADRIAALIRSGEAQTIHTAEPDLETVFMKLTGKELSA